MDNLEQLIKDAATRANKAELSQISTDGMSMLERLELRRVRPTDTVKADPVVLWVKGEPEPGPFGTLGNFSMITGKAKSKKSFTLALTVASAIKGSTYDAGPFTCEFPADKYRVIYFDTEQGRHRVWEAVNRVCKMAGVDNPTDLEYYDLRPDGPEDRVKLIAAKLHEDNAEKNIGLVIIDGIRDLLHDFNDPREASQLATHLMQWSANAHCHIIIVLHQNKSKGDNNARGHLGSELTNKAETVINVEVHDKDKSISVVKPGECRNIDFQSFAFTVNAEGLPELIAEFDIEGNNKKSNGKFSVDRFPIETHEFLAKQVFKNGAINSGDDLISQIKYQFHCIGINIGITYAKQVKAHWEEIGLMKNKSRRGKEGIYEYIGGSSSNPG